MHKLAMEWKRRAAEGIPEGFVKTLEGAGNIPVRARPYFLIWLRKYLGYCAEKGLSMEAAGSLERFLEDHWDTEPFQLEQAWKAVHLFWNWCARDEDSDRRREGDG